MKTRNSLRRHLLLIAAALTPCASLHADDADAFPLGSLGGKALQSPGTNLLKVTAVTSGGPAASAGLQIGDYIHAVNGSPLSILSTNINDGWKGSVAELGNAIEKSESSGGAVLLGVIRPGTGALTLNAALPANTLWRPSYPVGDTRANSLFEQTCSDLHTKIQASSTGDFGYNTGWFGMTLLASPNWNDTSGTKPYRNSINKLRDRCISYLNGRVLEPVEPSAPGYVDPGLENWDISASCMFIGEYRRKTGDSSVDVDVQRCALLLANRIQHYSQPDDGGTMHNKLGIMGHGGVTGDYAHLWLTGLNIINAHTMVAMGTLKGAGADFSAIAGSSGLTIDQKFLMNWSWLKACTRTDNGSDDGCVGYQGVESGWDAAGRTAGSAAGYQIYLNAGGTAANADDLDKLARMKAYVVRHWQRQQHAHAYTAGGFALSQCLMPFLEDRGQRHFMENSRFYYTLSRDHTGAVQYFPGRGNNGGDSYLDFNNVRYWYGGLFQALALGNLPSFPAPSTSRAFVRMNAPANDWPQLAARRAKVVGLVQNLNLDVTNHLGDVLTSGYTATWSQVSGAAVSFSTTSSEDTTITFPAAGNYRLRLTAAVGSYNVTEDYDFEVATSVTPPVANVITTQPVSRVGVPGGNATFTVGATGDGPFVYEWKLNGTAYWGTSSSGTLTLSNISIGHAGTYVCTVYTPTGTLTSNAATLSIPTTSTLTNGGLKREVWNSLSGNAISNLTGSSRYPLFPDITSVATSIETPSAYGDNYGEQYTGWIIPPTSGQYKFFVASDDASEVWLSTNDSPSNKVKICQVTGYTGLRAYSSGGQSAFITLTAGNRYYIEVLHKEGGGGDHLALAWQLPGGSAPANGSEPIGSAYLQYEAVSADPALNGLVSWWKMDEGSGTLAADVLSTANDGTLNAPVWATGKRGGALTFDGNDRVTCSNLGALNGTTPFTAAAWVKVNAGANADAIVVQQRATNGFNGQYQLKITAAGKAGFYVYGNSAEQFNFAGATSINDGQWHHIAGVRDASGNASIYVDGLLDGSVTGTTVRSLSSSINIGIGCDIRDSNKYFRGSIDDVRVYNRALTAAEIVDVRNLAPAFASNPLDGAAASEDSAYSGSISATDPEGETITYSKQSGPAWLAVASGGTLTGTPSNIDVGANSFTVRASDTSGGVTDVTLNISVANSNDPPAFNLDPIQLAATEDTAFSDQLAASDPDAGDSLTYTKVSGPAWLTVSPSGSLSGTPGNGDVGASQFTVRVTDGSGASDDASLVVTVANVNDAPAFDADPIILAASEDSAFSGQLAATDIDAGETLTFTKLSGPSWLNVSTSGALAGTPGNNDVGANNFTVRVTDGSGASDDASLVINVTNTNDAPVFNTDPMTRADATTGAAYTGQTLAGTATDVDAGDTITYSKVSGPAWLTVAADGTLGGTPAAGDVGSNNFTVRVTDAGSATDEATLQINVVSSMLAWWTFNEGTGTIAADSSGNGRDASLQGATWSMPRDGHAAVSTNGTSAQYLQAPSLDTAGGLTIAAWIKPAALNGHRALVSEKNSYVFKTNGSGLVFTTPGILDHYSSGVTLATNTWTHVAVSFQPGATGGVRFYVNGALASSGNASAMNQSTEPTILGNTTNWTGQEYNGALDDVRIYGGILGDTAITDLYSSYPPPPAPVAPSFTNDPIAGTAATEDAAYNGTLAGSATDPDVGDTLSYLKVSGPAWLAVASNGSLSGTPANSDVGPNSFTVRVTDSTGLTDDAVLDISVANTNDAPSFIADPITGTTATEDTAYAASLAGSASDIDAGDSLSYSKLSGPAWLNVAPNGALTGTPGNGDVGANSFTVRVTDGSGTTDDAVLDILVTNVNDAPAFTADPVNLAATEDTAFTGQLSATDIDAGETLTFTKLTGPSWLTVSSGGSLSGTPTNSNVGANGFTVRVTDGSGTTDEAVLNVTVSNVNDAPAFTIDPIVKADAAVGTAYTGQTIAGSAADVDAGDSITYSKVSGPAWLSVAANGALTGTPPSGSSGLNTFVVRATDGSSATDDAELRINVTGLPLPWTNGDIGTGMLAGSASHNSGTFTQAGSGALGGTTDCLHYTYQSLTGDGEIIARVSSLQNTGTSSRVGVMIRESLATNSRMIFMGLTSSGNYRWARRTSTGGSVSTTNSSSGTVPNTWVRLTRVGNVITAYKSSNGTSWTTVGSTTVTMAANCYIGLTVSSGSTTTLNTSQFTNVSVTP